MLTYFYYSKINGYNFYINSVKVLYTFDSGFNSAFGESGMNEVMALVKNSFKDKPLVNNIGTNVNIIGEKKRYYGTFSEADL